MPKPVSKRQNMYVFLEPIFFAKGTRSKAESIVTILYEPFINPVCPTATSTW